LHDRVPLAKEEIKINVKRWMLFVGCTEQLAAIAHVLDQVDVVIDQLSQNVGDAEIVVDVAADALLCLLACLDGLA